MISVRVGSCNVLESEKHLFGRTKKEHIVTAWDVWQASWSPNAGFHARKIYGSSSRLLGVRYRYLWMTAKEVNELIGCKLLNEAENEVWKA